MHLGINILTFDSVRSNRFMITRILNLKKPFSDYLGALGSLLCLFHCLVMPFIFTVPLFYLNNNTPIDYLEYLFLSISFIAVYFSSRKIPTHIEKILIWALFCLLSISLILHNYIPLFFSFSFSIGLLILHLKRIIYFK